MAVELRNALGSMVGRTLPATLLFDHPTIGALTNHLAADLIGSEPSPTTGVQEEPANVGTDDLDALLGSIEQLSQDEVERRIRNAKVPHHG